MIEDRAVQGSIRETGFPLRMFRNSEHARRRHLAAPFEEIGEDTVIIRSMRRVPSTLRISLFSEVSPEQRAEGFYTFHRDILLSLATSGLRIATMTGYLWTGPVDVYPWKDRVRSEYPRSAADDKQLELVRSIQMQHVHGLVNAVRHHQQRLEGLDLQAMTLADGLETYKAMAYNIPSR